MGIALDDYEPGVRFSAEQPKPRLTFVRSRTMREIAEDVCSRYGVKMTDLCGENRGKSIKFIRWEFWHIVRQETKQSLPQIGQFTGGRDHTTVLHGLRRWAELMAD